MRSIGLLAVILFLASLAAFMGGFMYPDWFSTGGTLGGLLLLAAAGLLAVTIIKRNKTERI
jgi:hypothetical protein